MSSELSELVSEPSELSEEELEMVSKLMPPTTSPASRPTDAVDVDVEDGPQYVEVSLPDVRDEYTLPKPVEVDDVRELLSAVWDAHGASIANSVLRNLIQNVDAAFDVASNLFFSKEVEDLFGGVVADIESMVGRSVLRDFRESVARRRVKYRELDDFSDASMAMDFRLKDVPESKKKSQILFFDDEVTARVILPPLDDERREFVEDTVSDRVSGRVKIREFKNLILKARTRRSTDRDVKEFIRALSVSFANINEMFEGQDSDPVSRSDLSPSEEILSEYDTPSVDDLELGDTIRLFDRDNSFGVDEYTVDETRGTRIVDAPGSSSQLTQELLDERALPSGEMPQSLQRELPDWFSNGTSVEISYPQSDAKSIVSTVSNLDGSVFSLARNVKQTIVAFGDSFYEIIDRYSDLQEGQVLLTPEYGEVVFLNDGNYNRYDVMLPDGSDEQLVVTDNRFFREVEIDVIEEPEQDSSLDKLGDEKKEQIVSTATEFIEKNPFNVSELKAKETRGSLLSDGAVAFYTFENDSITFDTQQTEESLMQKAQKHYDRGWLAGPDLTHLALHEACHALHYNSLDMNADEVPQKWNETANPKDEITAAYVSEYAKENPLEFVAETGALIAAGRLEEEVYRLFREEVREVWERIAGMSVNEVTPINE